MNGNDQSLQEIQAVIVLPYLNEREFLSAACRSLGFGDGEKNAPPNTSLILVDNGSSDDSPRIAQVIKENSPYGRVITEYEPERGYVPPRHRGCLSARSLAEINGWSESDVLILQADADILYPKSYSANMLSATLSAGSNAIIEAFMTYPEEFLTLHRGYFELEFQAVAPLQDLFAPEEDDCLAVDSVSGYRLDDYFNWGAHRREYNTDGDEIHAETTRLYLSAKAKGATRFRAENVLCRHSARKITLEPALHFATAGFPREQRWKQKWRDSYHGPSTLPEFYNAVSDPEVEKSIVTCQQHLISLLTMLPYHVNAALGKEMPLKSENMSSLLHSNLPRRSFDDLSRRPGVFLSDVFELSEKQGSEFIKIAARLYG